jgi:hypothetical protein
VRVLAEERSIMTTSNQKTAARQLMQDQGVNYTTALRQLEGGGIVPAGIHIGTTPTGEPLTYAPATDGHLLIIGGQGTGKTNLSRLIAAANPTHTVVINAPERDSRFGRSVQNLTELNAAIEAARKTLSVVAAALNERLLENKPAEASLLVVIDDADDFLDQEEFTGSEPGIITERMKSRNRSRNGLMLAVLDLLWLGRESGITVVLAARTLHIHTQVKIRGALTTDSTRILLGDASYGERSNWLRENSALDWRGEMSAGDGVVEYSDGRAMLMRATRA